MDFYSLKRKELQALCKKHDLPANFTNLKMAESLTALLHVKPRSTSNSGSGVEGDSGEQILKKCLRDSDNAEKRVAKRVRFSQDEDTNSDPTTPENCGKSETISNKNNSQGKKRPTPKRLRRGKTSLDRTTHGSKEGEENKGEIQEIPEVSIRVTRFRAMKMPETISQDEQATPLPQNKGKISKKSKTEKVEKNVEVNEKFPYVTEFYDDDETAGSDKDEIAKKNGRSHAGKALRSLRNKNIITPIKSNGEGEQNDGRKTQTLPGKVLRSLRNRDISCPENTRIEEEIEGKKILILPEDVLSSLRRKDQEDEAPRQSTHFGLRNKKSISAMEEITIEEAGYVPRRKSGRGHKDRDLEQPKITEANVSVKVGEHAEMEIQSKDQRKGTEALRRSKRALREHGPLSAIEDTEPLKQPKNIEAHVSVNVEEETERQIQSNDQKKGTKALRRSKRTVLRDHGTISATDDTKASMQPKEAHVSVDVGEETETEIQSKDQVKGTKTSRRSRRTVLSGYDSISATEDNVALKQPKNTEAHVAVNVGEETETEIQSKDQRKGTKALRRSIRTVLRDHASISATEDSKQPKNAEAHLSVDVGEEIETEIQSKDQKKRTKTSRLSRRTILRGHDSISATDLTVALKQPKDTEAHVAVNVEEENETEIQSKNQKRGSKALRRSRRTVLRDHDSISTTEDTEASRQAMNTEAHVKCTKMLRQSKQTALRGHGSISATEDTEAKKGSEVLRRSRRTGLKDQASVTVTEEKEIQSEVESQKSDAFFVAEEARNEPKRSRQTKPEKSGQVRRTVKAMMENDIKAKNAYGSLGTNVLDVEFEGCDESTAFTEELMKSRDRALLEEGHGLLELENTSVPTDENVTEPSTKVQTEGESKVLEFYDSQDELLEWEELVEGASMPEDALQNISKEYADDTKGSSEVVRDMHSKATEAVGELNDTTKIVAEIHTEETTDLEVGDTKDMHSKASEVVGIMEDNTDVALISGLCSRETGSSYENEVQSHTDREACGISESVKMSEVSEEKQVSKTFINNSEREDCEEVTMVSNNTGTVSEEIQKLEFEVAKEYEEKVGSQTVLGHLKCEAAKGSSGVRETHRLVESTNDVSAVKETQAIVSPYFFRGNVLENLEEASGALERLKETGLDGDVCQEDSEFGQIREAVSEPEEGKPFASSKFEAHVSQLSEEGMDVSESLPEEFGFSVAKVKDESVSLINEKVTEELACDRPDDPGKPPLDLLDIIGEADFSEACNKACAGVKEDGTPTIVDSRSSFTVIEINNEETGDSEGYQVFNAMGENQEVMEDNVGVSGLVMGETGLTHRNNKRFQTERQVSGISEFVEESEAKQNLEIVLKKTGTEDGKEVATMNNTIERISQEAHSLGFENVEEYEMKAISETVSEDHEFGGRKEDEAEVDFKTILEQLEYGSTKEASGVIVTHVIAESGNGALKVKETHETISGGLGLNETALDENNFIDEDSEFEKFKKVGPMPEELGPIISGELEAKDSKECEESVNVLGRLPENFAISAAKVKDESISSINNVDTEELTCERSEDLGKLMCNLLNVSDETLSIEAHNKGVRDNDEEILASDIAEVKNFNKQIGDALFTGNASKLETLPNKLPGIVSEECNSDAYEECVGENHSFMIISKEIKTQNFERRLSLNDLSNIGAGNLSPKCHDDPDSSCFAQIEEGEGIAQSESEELDCECGEKDKMTHLHGGNEFAELEENRNVVGEDSQTLLQEQYFGDLGHDAEQRETLESTLSELVSCQDGEGSEEKRETTEVVAEETKEVNLEEDTEEEDECDDGDEASSDYVSKETGSKTSLKDLQCEDEEEAVDIAAEIDKQEAKNILENKNLDDTEKIAKGKENFEPSFGELGSETVLAMFCREGGVKTTEGEEATVTVVEAQEMGASIEIDARELQSVSEEPPLEDPEQAEEEEEEASESVSEELGYHIFSEELHCVEGAEAGTVGETNEVVINVFQSFLEKQNIRPEQVAPAKQSFESILREQGSKALSLKSEDGEAANFEQTTEIVVMDGSQIILENQNVESSKQIEEGKESLVFPSGKLVSEALTGKLHFDGGEEAADIKETFETTMENLQPESNKPTGDYREHIAKEKDAIPSILEKDIQFEVNKAAEAEELHGRRASVTMSDFTKGAEVEEIAETSLEANFIEDVIDSGEDNRAVFEQKGNISTLMEVDLKYKEEIRVAEENFEALPPVGFEKSTSPLPVNGVLKEEEQGVDESKAEANGVSEPQSSACEPIKVEGVMLGLLSDNNYNGIQEKEREISKIEGEREKLEADFSGFGMEALSVFAEAPHDKEIYEDESNGGVTTSEAKSSHSRLSKPELSMTSELCSGNFEGIPETLREKSETLIYKMTAEEEEEEDAELFNYMRNLFTEVEEDQSRNRTLDPSESEGNLPPSRGFHKAFEMEYICRLLQATHISVPMVELSCGNEILTTLDFRTSLETPKFKSPPLKVREGPVMKENRPSWSRGAKMSGLKPENARTEVKTRHALGELQTNQNTLLGVNFSL
ncbi:hypothetical protein AMTRI_Chr11g99300 [Amborella trichopoda]